MANDNAWTDKDILIQLRVDAMIAQIMEIFYQASGNQSTEQLFLAAMRNAADKRLQEIDPVPF